ncbi:MAG TPA: oxaloacetate decarboxylase [Lachnospiraceae bacterium]|nr:oxaloacetate decarboxylase [Lachnospiraceae bacterium]
MKKNSKLLAITILIISIYGIVLSIGKMSRDKRSVTIIGGADGPTSIFLAGKMENTVNYPIIISLIIVLMIAIFLFIKSKRK